MTLTNTLYDLIMNSYEKENIKNEIYIEKILKKNPKIQDLIDSIHEVSLKKTKEKLNNNTKKYKNYEKQLKNLIKEKKLLLEDLIKNDKNIHVCKLCNNTGFINGKKCKCFIKKEIQLLYKNSGLTISNSCSFKNFDLSLYSKNFIDKASGMSAYDMANKTLKEALNYIKNFNKQAENIYIYGDVGVGKTFTINCIATEILNSANITILYLSSNALFNILIEKFNENNKRISELVFSCDLLIIDDLGTETQSDFKTSELFNIINTRNNYNLSTIISSNLSLKNISERYSTRIYSRIISNYKILKLVGDDIRLKKKFKNKKIKII